MKYILFLVEFIKDIFQGRQLIIELAKKDFQKKYLGSYLGITWGFVQPLVNILIFWFVFQVGFKSTPVDNFPFILWLMCGMIPWFFFSDAVINATNSFTENSYLIKNIVFKISILPIIKVLSSLFVHLFFIIVLFLMFWIYGYKLYLVQIQVIYYLLATITLVLSTSLITSSLMVFVKDIGQIVNMILQILFWLTPIFWSLNILPSKYLFFFKLNPLYYIIDGYRSTFIYHYYFWQNMNLTIYFWVVNICILFIALILFKRLKPHFADAL